ncbi:MAG: GWxTD domain-containing protein [Bacteroidota bacterium]
MKKFSLIVLFCLFLFNINTLQAKRLAASLVYAHFFSPTQGPFLETYLSVYGKSVNFVKNANNKFQATIEVTMIFKQNNKVKDFKKYNLLSTEVEDTLNLNFNFLDQQRFVLPNGTYDFEFSIADKNSIDAPFKTNNQIIIDFPEDKINLAGIEFIESYKKSVNPTIVTKSGYDLIPYISDFYPDKVTKFTFYSEIYNCEKLLGKDDMFLLKYYIETSETNRTINDFVKNKRELVKPVNVIFGEFDISKLPSGNYNLVIEVRDKENKVLSFNKVAFQRSNPSIQYDVKDLQSMDISETFVGRISDKDSLVDIIKSLYPISSDFERNFINNQIKKVDITVMQQFILNFWLQRDNFFPETAWHNYQIEVARVNANFGNKFKKGYETDRGRVYLQYGPPNQRYERPFETSKGLTDEGWGSVPYEIWQYYTIQKDYMNRFATSNAQVSPDKSNSVKNYNNKKFVFYNPNLALGDYELIHSNMQGEIYDSNWEMKLSRSNDLYENTGDTKPAGKAGELFNNPH